MSSRAFRKATPCTCPKCFKEGLAVHEVESTIYKINDIAERDEEIQNDYECEIVCLECGEIFEPMTKGNKWFIYQKPIPRNLYELGFNPFQKQ